MESEKLRNIKLFTKYQSDNIKADVWEEDAEQDS